MTDWPTPSTDQPNEQDANEAASLLGYYNFDLGRYTIHQLVHHWVQQYPVQWVRLAIIEAIYQGRYKSISVEQILNLWQRKGQPRHHFNHEFERIVCNKLPQVPDIHQPQSDAVSIEEISTQKFSSYHQSSEPITLNPPAWHSHSSPPPAELISLRESLDSEEQANQAAVEQRSFFAPMSGKTQSGLLPISFKIHTNKIDQSNKTDQSISKSTSSEGKSDVKKSPILPRLEPYLPREDTIQDFTPKTEPSEFYDKLRAVSHPAREPSATELPETQLQNGETSQTDVIPLLETGIESHSDDRPCETSTQGDA